jgi:hypothetical protein
VTTVRHSVECASSTTCRLHRHHHHRARCPVSGPRHRFADMAVKQMEDIQDSHQQRHHARPRTSSLTGTCHRRLLNPRNHLSRTSSPLDLPPDNDTCRPEDKQSYRSEQRSRGLRPWTARALRRVILFPTSSLHDRTAPLPDSATSRLGEAQSWQRELKWKRPPSYHYGSQRSSYHLSDRALHARNICATIASWCRDQATISSRPRHPTIRMTSRTTA